MYGSSRQYYGLFFIFHNTLYKSQQAQFIRFLFCSLLFLNIEILKIYVFWGNAVHEIKKNVAVINITAVIGDCVSVLQEKGGGTPCL